MNFQRTAIMGILTLANAISAIKAVYAYKHSVTPPTNLNFQSSIKKRISNSHEIADRYYDQQRRTTTTI